MRVLVVYKKSRYRIYLLERKNKRMARLIRARHDSVRAMLEAHEAHERALERVCEILRRAGVDLAVRYRAELARDGYDLIVTVGGDGTLLEAARVITDTPVLAVNSSRRHSVGFFCGADEGDMEERIALALAGKLRAVPLSRAAVTVDGAPVGPPVLNDVLFCNDNPAVTSRYVLRVGRVREAQKSSGIWIGTPAGSTAALRSAGGDLLPVRARKIEWVVREPYAPPGGPPVRLRKGVCGPAAQVGILNAMRQAMLYFDGGHRKSVVEMGQLIEVGLHRHPLRLLGFRGR